MSHIIRHRDVIKRSAFTLAEVLTASVITLLVLLGTMTVYMMGRSVSAEAEPQADAQRIARLALSSIIDGNVDPTAGSDTIGGTSVYGRKNGIANAVGIPGIPNTNRINFRLEADLGNVRSFYLGVEPASGLNAVYYLDSGGVAHLLSHTLGISNLTFANYNGLNNMISVTVEVNRVVPRGNSPPLQIDIVYNSIVNLRNLS